MYKALLHAASTNSEYLQIISHTVGVVFLSTPLRGIQANWTAKWRLYVADFMGEQVSDTLIKDLDVKTGSLKTLVQRFSETANEKWLQLPIHCFYETKTTEVLRAVVSRGSASFLSKVKWMKDKVNLLVSKITKNYNALLANDSSSWSRMQLASMDSGAMH